MNEQDYRAYGENTVTAGSTIRGAIGLNDFMKLRDECRYYVDKTALIDDILRGSSEVYLFTRPRRFGKSINLSMIDAYLNERYAEDPDRFEGLRISELRPGDPEKNSNVVVNLNLNLPDCRSFDMFLDNFAVMMSRVYAGFPELRTSEELDDNDRRIFEEVYRMQASRAILNCSLSLLCEMLEKHHGRRVVVLIDEYDSAVNDAASDRLREEILELYSAFLGKALKYNRSLKLAVMTGIMQVSKASIFSKLNNLYVDSVFSSRFDEYFGFTEDEVRTICTDFGHPERFEEAKEWYDGYRFGNTDVYNPWSIMRYVSDGFVTGSYWSNTGSDVLLNRLYIVANEENSQILVKLLAGDSVEVGLKTSMSFDEIGPDSTSLFSLMTISGCLKAVPVSRSTYAVSFPNLEIRGIMEDIVAGKVMPTAGNDTEMFCAAVLSGDAEQIGGILGRILLQGSYYNLVDENSYTLVVMTLLRRIAASYTIRTEMEHGNGRADLVMASRNPTRANIIIEMKVSDSENNLETDAAGAIAQIHKRRYYLDMEGTVELYGIACWGKIPLVKHERIAV